MRCPSRGAEIPPAAGQHSTVPTVDVMECPSCGANVRIEADEEPGVERATEGGWGEPRPESFAASETLDELKEEVERKEEE
jgi:hypothetical protein